MLNKYTNIRTVGIRFILYSFIGVSGVAIDFILFYILVSIIGIHYIPANIISIFSGATNNFILNARLNFKVHDKKNYTLHLISIYCMRWHALLINRYLYLRLPIRTFGYYRKNSINIDCHPNPVHTEHINNFQEKAMKKELGLVVPVYNESGAIKEVIQSWETVLSGLNINFDIHIYNDGSKDNTLKILTAEAENYDNLFIHDKKNSGHGPTILLGYNENVNNYEWLFQIDSDNEMSPNDFSQL